MRSSFIESVNSGQVILPTPLLDQLQIGKDCILYGVIARKDKSVVLSNIPCSSWSRAYRLVVYTAPFPGSLAQTTKVVSELGVNFLASWDVPISPIGDGCFTSVVEIPEKWASNAHDLEAELNKKLSDLKVLSESSLFKNKDGGPRLIRLVPLSVLAAIGCQTENEAKYILHVKDWTLDLNERSQEASPLRLFMMLERMSKPNSRDTRTSNQLLLTTDTEERYFRIALLPPDKDLRRIKFNVNITSSNAVFQGYFQRALSVLAEHNLNCYGAKNVVVSKELSKDQQIEKAEFNFVVDLKDLSHINSDDPGILRNKLKKEIEQTLKDHAERTKSQIKIGRDFSLLPYLASRPRVFLATNAKDIQGNCFACKLYRALVAQGLNPVNVDITMSDSVLEDVIHLLKASPLLVSLLVPEEKQRLAQDNEFAPSDWVLFEEAYMSGLGRKILRMRHKEVRQPRYWPGAREYVFSEGHSFDKELLGLIAALQRHLTTNRWRKSLYESGKIANTLDPALLERNLESEFCNQGVTS